MCFFIFFTHLNWPKIVNWRQTKDTWNIVFSKGAPWITSFQYLCDVLFLKRQLLSLEEEHLRLFHSLKFYLFLEHVFKNRNLTETYE